MAWRGTAVPGLPASYQRPPVSRPCRAECKLPCPPGLARDLALNGLCADEGTRTDGDCGLDAFTAGLLREATVDLKLAKTDAVKRLRAAGDRRCQEARALAVAWVRDHARDEVWGGAVFHKVCVAISRHESFDDYVRGLGTQGEWVDTASLHALACACGVDVCVFQSGRDPTLLGPSTTGDARAAVPIIPVAIENDFHFWGCLEADVPLIDYVDKDDAALAVIIRGRATHTPTKRRRTTAARDDDADEDGEDIAPPTVEAMVSDDGVEVELAFIQCLRQWDPFASPTETVLRAIADLAAFGDRGVHPDRVERVLARAPAMQQLAYEQEHFDALPEYLRYQKAAR